MTKNTGGPAFPHKAYMGTRINYSTNLEGFVYWEQPGAITLRDYFAAKAMQGQLCAQANSDFGIWKDFEAMAEEAYRISDAMIEEREK